MSSTLLLCTDQKSIIEIFNVDLNVRLENNPDLYLINQNNDSIKIKEIREIGKKIIYPPSKQEFKTFILYSFEKATIPAQNAFLKSLEEHPSYIQFILQCNSLNGILETVKSRCEIKRCLHDREKNKEDVILKTKDLSNSWNTISTGSYADIIELCSQYKDRNEALQFITNLTTFIHTKNQSDPTKPLTNSLTNLSICLAQLKQNSNVLLTLENHFFIIKSRF
jgi:DNA polymerase III delta prime subunit